MARPEPAVPAPLTAPEVVAERGPVLFVALIDHLDRSERALTELVNAAPAGTLDISAEQGWVRDLVPANQLIRQSATEVGEEI